eukprot:TRINITY_DN26174_c0_g2_i1.p1 TRINITY_DN26174_c0_g2~~TRINITY_DN26174_c0_g2_i1.p1  ORF type:complete len:236 (+),score=37.13 TRINITY_DN26174_c0_g2_i1:74-781(+)
MTGLRAQTCVLAATLLCIGPFLGRNSPRGLSFVGPSAVRLPATSVEVQPRLVQSGFGLAATQPVATPLASSSSIPTDRSTGWQMGVAAFAVAAFAAWSGRQRKDSPVICYGNFGRMAVRQWAPEEIPPSKRRSEIDRIRMYLFAHQPHDLEEAVETLQEYAKDTGGEVEGPHIFKCKRLHHYLNKSPKGHKKSKYHLNMYWHKWSMDFYPPKEGGLDSMMKLRLPHCVHVKIADN